jgi:hypothetical protein
MPHCSLLILILIFILSSERAKWNCHLSFHNLRDQLLPSIYPWLRNRCLVINNSSLLVTADMSHVPAAWQCPDISALCAEWNISPCLYSSLYLLLIQSGKRGKWNYTIHRKIVMPELTCIRSNIDRFSLTRNPEGEFSNYITLFLVKEKIKFL